MNASSINRLARFLEGYGLAECPIVECASNLTKRRGKFDARLRLVERVVDLETAVKFVSTLTVPDSRHAAVAAANWTVFINNARNGSDYHNHTRSFPLHLDARFARIVSRPGKTWNNNAIRLKLQYAATIFELYDRRGDSIRSVCCMDDGGRWTFDEGGDPHPVEATFPYQNKKKRERFTSKELARLAASFGLPEVTTKTFENAESFYLFKCDVHNHIQRSRRRCFMKKGNSPLCHTHHELFGEKGHVNEKQSNSRYWPGEVSMECGRMVWIDAW